MHNIIGTAVADGNFKTLAAALTTANLVDPLKGTGPFAVFVPTDDAFAKLRDCRCGADAEMTMARVFRSRVALGAAYTIC